MLDLKDHCDNTTLGLEVDLLGCAKDTTELVDMPVTNTIDLESLSFKDKFINSNGGFTLNLATFSSQKEVDKFLKESKLEDNHMVFTYLTQRSHKKLIRIVSGVFETKKDARKALSKLPGIVRVNKPYLDNLKKVKDLYNKFN